MKKIISLKLKVFFLMMIIPIIIFLCYFFLAERMIVEDKKSYIFSSSLSNINTFTRNIRNYFSTSQKISEMLLTKFFENYASSNGFNQFVVESFLNQNVVDSLHVWQVGGGKSTKISELNKLDFSVKNDVYIEDLEIFLGESKIYFKGKDNALLFFYDLGGDEEKRYKAVIGMNATRFKDLFFSSRVLMNYLVDEKGNVVFGTNVLFKDFKKWNFFSHDILKKRSIEGGKLNSIDGQKYLVTYKQLTEGYYVVSVMNTKEAFYAVDSLERKSLILILALVALSIVFVILFSNTITYALRDLYNAVMAFRKGDLNARTNIISQDEVGVLGESFNKMLDEINQLLTKLKKYSEKLEEMVEDRTKDLNRALSLQKAMVDGLEQGFCIFDKNLAVLDTYSKAAEKIFLGAPSGRSLDQLINIPYDEKSDFEMFCSDMFLETLPFSELAELAPTKFKNSMGRIITLDYSPIREEDNSISGIVLIATDKTNELLAQEEAEREKNFVKMILKILEFKHHFLLFLKESRDLLKNIKDLSQISQINIGQLNELFRNLHTLKGNSGLYNMVDIQKTSQDFEDFVSEMIKNNQLGVDREKFDYFYQKLSDHLRDFLNTYGKTLGVAELEDNKESFEISLGELREFWDVFKVANVPLEIIENFYLNIFCRPIGPSLERFKNLVGDIAKRLGKDVAPLDIRGGEIKVFYPRFDDLLSTLIHSLRNSLDHGIETPTERERANKPRTGNITIQVSEKSIRKSLKALVIQVIDDGRGIDPSKVREKLEKNGVNELVLAKPDQDIIQMIFEPQFSTKDDIDSLSGRGVGMDAIKFAAEKISGYVDVSSNLGEGTTVRIVVPIATDIKSIRRI